MRKYSTGYRKPSVFVRYNPNRAQALGVRDHARHLATYYKVIATLRERGATLVQVAMATRALEKASVDPLRECLFCRTGQSGKMATLIARVGIKAAAEREQASKSAKELARERKASQVAEAKAREQIGILGSASDRALATAAVDLNKRTNDAEVREQSAAINQAQ